MPSLNFTHIFDGGMVDSLRLLNSNVLIETFDNRAFKNGVYLTTSEDAPFVPRFGKVVMMDPCVTDIKVGDQVCFEPYKGDRCQTDDGKRTFLLMKSSMVLAIVDNIDVSKL